MKKISLLIKVCITLTGTLQSAGDYEKAVESSNSAEALTRVLYPNVRDPIFFERALCILTICGRTTTWLGKNFV